MNTAQAKKLSKPIRSDVENEDELYDTRPPTSVRRYHSHAPVQSGTLDDLYEDEPYIQQRRASRKIKEASRRDVRTTAISRPIEEFSTEDLPRPRRFPLVPLMVGMVIMVVLVMSMSLIVSWWQVYQDDLHYGRPRTYQMDAVVGHNDGVDHPTHFIFLNLNRHVEIIEIPGGDGTKTRIFVGPVLFGDGQNLVPVTGEIRNDNGRKDLVVHIQNQEIVFINDGTTFHPQ